MGLNITPLRQGEKGDGYVVWHKEPGFQFAYFYTLEGKQIVISELSVKKISFLNWLFRKPLVSFSEKDVTSVRILPAEWDHKIGPDYNGGYNFWQHIPERLILSMEKPPAQGGKTICQTILIDLRSARFLKDIRDPLTWVQIKWSPAKLLKK